MIKPYYQDTYVAIYLGNCLEIMPELEAIDLVVTSPPYNNWRNKRTQASRASYWERTNITYKSYSDKMSDQEYRQWQIKIINSCLAILKETGTICYNHKDQIYNFQVTSPLEWILESNATYRQRITWNRGGMQAYNPIRFYRVEEDIYILGRNTSYKWNKDCAKYLSIWEINPSPKEGHPASFPSEIPKRCIKAFTHNNDLVLDPFMGSGTTLVAAKELGRKAIGIDIEEKYCEIAVNRIEKAIKRDRMSFHFDRKEKKRGEIWN